MPCFSFGSMGASLATSNLAQVVCKMRRSHCSTRSSFRQDCQCIHFIPDSLMYLYQGTTQAVTTTSNGKVLVWHDIDGGRKIVYFAKLRMSPFFNSVERPQTHQDCRLSHHNTVNIQRHFGKNVIECCHFISLWVQAFGLESGIVRFTDASFRLISWNDKVRKLVTRVDFVLM